MLLFQEGSVLSSVQVLGTLFMLVEANPLKALIIYSEINLGSLYKDYILTRAFFTKFFEISWGKI